MSSAERLPTDQCTRDAIATHRMMTSMLVETERYLAKLRASAEAEAAEIIGSAEDEAWALVRATHDEITTMFDVAQNGRGCGSSRHEGSPPDPHRRHALTVRQRRWTRLRSLTQRGRARAGGDATARARAWSSPCVSGTPGDRGADDPRVHPLPTDLITAHDPRPARVERGAPRDTPLDLAVLPSPDLAMTPARSSTTRGSGSEGGGLRHGVSTSIGRRLGRVESAHRAFV